MNPSTKLTMKHIMAVLLLFTTLFAKAQSAKELIEQGVTLHDEGAFEEAIQKYDAALALEPSNYLAMYEKSYSLMSLKRNDDAEKILKRVIKECDDPQTKKLAYVSYGTLADYKGNSKEALKIYDRGIKEFPDSYLLYFNKGITQNSRNENEDAIASFQKAIQLNPYHASSHNALGRSYVGKSRVKAMISLFTFLQLEPQGNRAKQNLQLFNKLLTQGISQKDDKSITISIDAAMLDLKKKPADDDFTASELMLSLLGANNSIPDSLGANTDGERLSYKMQLFFGGLSETAKSSKGFYTNFYIPFLKDMKEKDMVTTACFIALASTEKDETMLWLDQNKSKLTAYNEWFKNYEWNKQ